MKKKDEKYEKKTIPIDGMDYERCTFTQCTLEYEGGIPPSFVECSLKGSNFAFVGSASNTLQLLRAMYHGGFKPVVEGTMRTIMDPGPEDAE